MIGGGSRERLAEQLRDQALSCRVMGSPLYAHILERAADDAEGGGPVYALLAEHLGPGRGDALALRMMAAVHRMVLAGRAPGLARFYPSAGGVAQLEPAWHTFREVIASEAEALRTLVPRPCQTNEVGRCAALMFGFLRAAAIGTMPLRMLEVGASAGLNLRFDHFRYGGGGAEWGDPSSPVDLTGHWTDAPILAPLSVCERLGCDPRPLDPSLPEDRLTLTASVWADQTGRLTRLRGAFEVAERVPASVETASVDEWLPSRLAPLPRGAATVVFHSVVDEYLPGPVRERFHAAMADAGGRATAVAPLFWIHLEPLTSARHHGVTMTHWPGGARTLLATCGAHGTDVRHDAARGG